MRIGIIVNPVHARTHRAHHRLVGLLTALDIRYRTTSTTPEAPGSRQAQDLVDWGAEAVVLLGGDGTLRSAAPILATAGSPVLVVPTGTANVFSRGFGLHTARSGLALCEDFLHGAAARAGVPVSVAEFLDASGTVRHEHFLSLAGIGGDARAVAAHDRAWGPLGYARGALSRSSPRTASAHRRRGTRGLVGHGRQDAASRRSRPGLPRRRGGERRPRIPRRRPRARCGGPSPRRVGRHRCRLPARAPRNGTRRCATGRHGGRRSPSPSLRRSSSTATTSARRSPSRSTPGSSSSTSSSPPGHGRIDADRSPGRRDGSAAIDQRRPRTGSAASAQRRRRLGDGPGSATAQRRAQWGLRGGFSGDGARCRPCDSSRAASAAAARGAEDAAGDLPGRSPGELLERGGVDDLREEVLLLLLGSLRLRPRCRILGERDLVCRACGPRLGACGPRLGACCAPARRPCPRPPSRGSAFETGGEDLTGGLVVDRSAVLLLRGEAATAARTSSSLIGPIFDSGARIRVGATGVGAPSGSMTVTTASPMPSEVSAPRGRSRISGRSAPWP